MPSSIPRHGKVFQGARNAVSESIMPILHEVYPFIRNKVVHELECPSNAHLTAIPHTKRISLEIVAEAFKDELGTTLQAPAFSLRRSIGIKITRIGSIVGSFSIFKWSSRKEVAGQKATIPQKSNHSHYYTPAGRSRQTEAAAPPRQVEQLILWLEGDSEASSKAIHLDHHNKESETRNFGTESLLLCLLATCSGISVA
ncbi:hypothetical protein CROQUDRAFT_103420 [Cronartium quercuum f. sp. fusiforme G11]|uniref:Uncharacterized protein n=1 Tax=Cronartium quercuum f. sp. fusiforme G11 TaxID=708437 RepID=A0A9P6NWK9_9BASI|nr:hypothetical protein CROQUDRAFT_103420 [Cronartium quercuum f. sp. fusiforme G11]